MGGSRGAAQGRASAESGVCKRQVAYDDGDIMRLEESQAIADKTVALNNTRTTTPPLRSLVRRDANAHHQEL